MAASKPTTFKPNQLVTLKMETTSGTWYTVWAPLWVVRGEKWQAFLGKDDTISVFSSPTELHAHVVGSNDHVLAEHPKWKDFKADADAQMSAQKIQEISLIEAPNQLAGRASYENVRDVSRAYRTGSSVSCAISRALSRLRMRMPTGHGAPSPGPSRVIPDSKCIVAARSSIGANHCFS